MKDSRLASGLPHSELSDKKGSLSGWLGTVTVVKEQLERGTDYVCWGIFCAETASKCEPRRPSPVVGGESGAGAGAALGGLWEGARTDTPGEERRPAHRLCFPS